MIEILELKNKIDPKKWNDKWDTIRDIWVAIREIEAKINEIIMNK